MKSSRHGTSQSALEGKALHKKMDPARLSQWTVKHRKQDPLRLLDLAARGRVKKLLPLKTQRMAASAFGFFRGAAPVMAYDLSLSPSSGIFTQLCGDAHVQNLGAYEGMDGRLIFDINDFDETIRGPFEWDIKRMATSILLAGADAHLKERDALHASQIFLDAYSGLIHQLAPLPVLEVARYQVHRLSSETPVSQLLQKAERTTPLHSRDQLLEVKDGHRVFRSQPPLLEPLGGSERKQVFAALKLYRDSLPPERQHFFDQFQTVDAAFKVVGTGSVGLRDYIVYLEGNGPDDPLLLQVKQEVASAYTAYLPRSSSPRLHQGRRVVNGQRAMQVQSDPLLGWTTIGKRDFLVRQLNDHKASLDVGTLDVSGLNDYARVCGEMLARGHARAGDAALLSGYLGHGKDFKDTMLSFASAYAGQTVADWKLMLAQRHK